MNRAARIATALLAVAAAAGWGGCGRAGGGRAGGGRAALREYLRQVEPPRLAVNRLLEGADPITTAYRRRRITAAQAQARMRRLERRFAVYGARVRAVDPVPAGLGAAHAGYAHAYVLEDRYLRALAAALPGGRFGGLPHTAGIQRAAVVRWRVRLHELARRAGLRLPADLEIAGRGEIAPSPEGD